MSLSKISVRKILTLSILIFSLFLFTQNTIADTFTVTNLNDSGPGSLRQAILDAKVSMDPVDEIVFMTGLTGTILLATGEMVITDDEQDIQY